MSPNKSLLTGPDLLNNLTGILLRFKNHKAAIVEDIEAMYDQVRVSEADAEALRFLWQDDLSKANPDVYLMVVHIFGCKDSPYCENYIHIPVFLNAVHSKNWKRPLQYSVMKSFYTDDFLK